MFDETVHPSDQDLLLCADGELSRRQAMMVRVHLEACWNCRARMAEIERTIGDFVKVHHRRLDRELPPIDGLRALLKARLSAAAQPSRPMRCWNLNSLLHPTELRSICALTLVLALTGGFLYLRTADFRSSANHNSGVLPNRSLTPGATRAVEMGEMCATDHDEVVHPVSGVLQQRVFKEYGLRDASVDNYEVDYLISPGLGGTDDIRNLWPQPRYNTTWNSFVKDQLEDYLHRSVCAGRLNLATVQKDVSSDWISAYKKYFGTNEPAGLSSSNSEEMMGGARRAL